MNKLSKSRYVAGVQCLKRLYWQFHAPELAAEPEASDYAVMEQGREADTGKHLECPKCHELVEVRVEYDAKVL